MSETPHKMIPRTDTAAVEAANVRLDTENAQLRQALRVIRKGLSEDADGEFWPARRWLDRRGIFHGDLSGPRVLELVAKHALHDDLSEPMSETPHAEELERLAEILGRSFMVGSADDAITACKAGAAALRQPRPETCDVSFAAEVIAAFLAMNVCPYGYDRDDLRAFVDRLQSTAPQPRPGIEELQGLAAHWRRFDGDGGGYADGYAEGRRDSADELEAVLAGNDPYGPQTPEADHSPTQTQGEGKTQEPAGGQGAQSTATGREENQGPSLALRQPRPGTCGTCRHQYFEDRNYCTHPEMIKTGHSSTAHSSIYRTPPQPFGCTYYLSQTETP